MIEADDEWRLGRTDTISHLYRIPIYSLDADGVCHATFNTCLVQATETENQRMILTVFQNVSN